MQEATVFMMPQRLRYLFALLLVHQTPKKPEKLWDTYIASMSEDYVKKGTAAFAIRLGNKNSGYSTENAIKKAYIDIVQYLSEMGTPIEKFPSMPVIDTGSITRNVDEVDIVIEERIYSDMYDHMNDKQKAIMQELIRLLEDKTACVTLDNGRRSRCIHSWHRWSRKNVYLRLTLPLQSLEGVQRPQYFLQWDSIESAP